MATQLAKLDDIDIAYEISGPQEAPAIVLGHCFCADHRFWDWHMPACDGYRVVRIDTRGHGQSGKPAGPYSLRMLAADVIGLLDLLQLDKVHFAGVSMGGMIGQTLALEHPDRIASLALVNTTPVYSDEQRSAWRERAQRVLRDGIGAVHDGLMTRWFTDAAIAGDNPGYRYMAKIVHRFSPQSFDAVTAAMCELNTVERLAQISVPALVVAAPEDPGVPPELSQLLAAKIADSELHWLTPARHLATLEHVPAFNRLLKAHLARVAPLQ